MKKLLASLVAIAFLSVSGASFAAEKKDEKKADKPKAEASKDGKAADAKAKKKKKEGC